MFKQLRFLALSSFAFVVIATIALALFSQQLIDRTLLSHAEQENQQVLALLKEQYPQQFEELSYAGPSRAVQRWFEQDLRVFSREHSLSWLALFGSQGDLRYRSSAGASLQPSLGETQLNKLRHGQSISLLAANPLGASYVVVTLHPWLDAQSELLGGLAIANDLSVIHQQFLESRNMLGVAAVVVMLLLYAVIFFSLRFADGELRAQHQELQQALAQQEKIKQELEQRVLERTAGLNKEIAERQQAELDLREKEAYLKAVMANTFNGIICIDQRGLIQSFNPTAERMFGYSLEQVVGRNVSMLMPKDHADRHDGYIEDYLETGEAHIIGNLRQLSAKRQDGSEFPIELAVTETEADGVPIFIGTIRDISDQRAAELAVIEARQKYYHQEKMAAIGFLAAGLVHEIGNPVAAISGLLDGVCAPCGIDPPPCNHAAQEQLVLAKEQVDRIIKITRDVSEFSTSHLQERDLQDLNNLIGRTCRLMRHDRRFTDVELLMELDSQIPAIDAVGDHLIQVLMNLLVNAVDAIGEAQPEQGVIHVCSGMDENQVWFSVEDNGCGMGTEVLQQAKEAFYTTKPVGKGTGLGLSLCQSLINEHGGELEISSAPGQGATVRVCLPLSSN